MSTQFVFDYIANVSSTVSVQGYMKINCGNRRTGEAPKVKNRTQ